MRYLLDTHVLLWWLNDDKALPPKIVDIISDEKNMIFVSAVTAWEIAIKKVLGKLSAPGDFGSIFLANNFKELPIRFHHVEALENLPHHHNDPFDRMLAAQAMCESLTLITADAKIAQYDLPVLKI